MSCREYFWPGIQGIKGNLPITDARTDQKTLFSQKQVAAVPRASTEKSDPCDEQEVATYKVSTTWFYFEARVLRRALAPRLAQKSHW